ncbi:MAG TPA: TetR/AcrR family transcriptional regulator, partial [Gemmatimonadales bacterium]|nr:TetR/AcrR family transcriptional regulator [Gemmatimonadales bacterium]
PVWKTYGTVRCMRKVDQRPLTPDDWARAALAAIARGGVDAVAVETVAAELGATKGSFYWHFKNRDALIQAALDKWEQRRTEAVIEEFEREPDPAIRLKKILEAGFELGPTDRAEIALLANPDHPAAVRAVRRVAERRITYIAEQLEKLGWDSGDALDRAVIMYYVYVGYLQMAHVTPAVISNGARQRHLELVFDAFAAAGELPTSQPIARG